MKFVDRASWLLPPLIVGLSVAYRITGSDLIYLADAAAVLVAMAWLVVSKTSEKKG